MSRVDIPTLKCDRCGLTTQDLSVMSTFFKLTHYHMGGETTWDLCHSCRDDFNRFMEG